MTKRKSYRLLALMANYISLLRSLPHQWLRRHGIWLFFTQTLIYSFAMLYLADSWISLNLRITTKNLKVMTTCIDYFRGRGDFCIPSGTFGQSMQRKTTTLPKKTYKRYWWVGTRKYRLSNLLMSKLFSFNR